MKKIDERTVEFTDEEQEAHDSLEDLLDQGWGIVDAANAVAIDWPDLDPEFWVWLQT